MYRLLIATILFLSVIAQAEMPLDLIQVFSSDTDGAMLFYGCKSPGDLNGDGYSEIYVSEFGQPGRLFAFSGSSTPDTIPDKNYGAISLRHFWIPDINNDGIQDFIIKRPHTDSTELIEIWFGSSDFLDKTFPDLTISHEISYDQNYANSVWSGDINADGQNDLVVSHSTPSTFPASGHFYFYYGGELLDTIMDDSINIYNPYLGMNNFYGGTAVGDINNDGFVDMAYSAIGESCFVAIILGDLEVDSLPDYQIWYPISGNLWGQSIVPLGDINKDSYDDFAVGGNNAWPVLFYGGEPFIPSFKFLGDTTDIYKKGESIANIGDINYDGWDDIGVGYTAYDMGEGIVYIFFGSREMDFVADLILPHYWTVPNSGMFFGESIGPAGDFNGDGVDDIVIGARQYYMSSQWDRGRVYVYAGDRTLPTPVEDENDNPIPQKYNILNQNYPNPFNNQTVIEYELWGVFDREIELNIYNILGQNVRTLYQGKQTGGKHITYWDGKDNNGRSVGSGMYFYRLSSQNETISKKMIYLK